MGSRNPRVVIPLAAAVWLAFVTISVVGAPPFVLATAIGVAGVVIPVVVAYLITDSGWRQLSARFRARIPYLGDWTTVRTAHMSRVPSDHSAYAEGKMRFLGTLRVAARDEGLHLSTHFSRVPLLGLFFPRLHIPWSEVASARAFQAPGWVSQNRGAAAQATYDLGYRGEFIELQIGDPPVYLQLPANLLDEHVRRLISGDFRL